MACRRTPIRALRINGGSQRAFSTSPVHQRLGAATYAQEWNTGTYHYNKSTSKLVSFAHKQTDKMLQQYITQQPKKGSGGYANKAAIASHRRKFEKVYVSGSRVKDFGGHVEVEAFVFDARAARDREDKVRDGAQGKGGRQTGGQGGKQQGGQGRKQGSGSGSSGAR